MSRIRCRMIPATSPPVASASPPDWPRRPGSSARAPLPVTWVPPFLPAGLSGPATSERVRSLSPRPPPRTEAGRGQVAHLDRAHHERGLVGGLRVRAGAGRRPCDRPEQHPADPEAADVTRGRCQLGPAHLLAVGVHARRQRDTVLGPDQLSVERVAEYAGAGRPGYPR